MRKFIFFVLLATAAMPTLAAVQTDGPGDRRAARAERSERAESDQPQRAERAERSERSGPIQSSVAPERTELAERVERVMESRAERSQHVQGPQNIDQPSNRRSSNGYSGRRNRPGGQADDGVTPVVNRDSIDSVTNWRGRERRSVRAITPGIPTTTTPPTPPTTTPTAGISGRGGSGTNWGIRTPDGATSTSTTRSGSWGGRDRDGYRWSGDWRHDGRYNWRHHRNRYSSLFRLGRYYDPFGYGYRRFSIGFSLWPSYYGNNYWLNDPWQYRLPPAYGPYRWIRYYDDALLVNIYDGQVVDVIHNFFW